MGWSVLVAAIVPVAWWSLEGSSPDEHFGEAVAIGDVDCDGDRDLVVSHDNGVEPELLVFAAGPGTLDTAPSWVIPLGTGSDDIALASADLDGDGCDDIALALVLHQHATSRGYGAATVIDGSPIGPGLPSYTSPATSTWDGCCASIATGDLDADGVADLVAGGVDSPHYGGFYWWIGGPWGIGAFGQMGVAWNGPWQHAGELIQMADMDADGSADVASPAWSSLAVYPGSARGPGSPASISFPTGPLDYALDDLDGDGFVDAIIGAIRWQHAVSPRSLGRIDAWSGVAAASGDEELLRRLDTWPGVFELGHHLAFVGDTDADGLAEVIATGGRATGPSSLLWLEGPDLAIQHPIEALTVSGFDPGLTSAGDLDGNGRVDVVLHQGSFGPSGAGRVEILTMGPYAHDRDGDGVSAGDCDDDAPGVHPGQPELLGDDVDQDCDGMVRCWQDLDGDGIGTGIEELRPAPPLGGCDGELGPPHASDCDDLDDTIFPLAAETVDDDVDQDCDGMDACWADADGDGFATYARALVPSADADCLDAGEAGWQVPLATGMLDGHEPVALAAAGDVDGDGYEDLLVGAWIEGIGLEYGGTELLLLPGGPAGLGSSPIWTWSVGFGSLDMFRSASQGSPIAVLPDIDGDGRGELLEQDFRRTRVFPSVPGGWSASHLWTPPGGGGAEVVLPFGDFSGDGLPELLLQLGNACGAAYDHQLIVTSWSRRGAAGRLWSAAPAGCPRGGLAAADVTGDGWDDVLLALEGPVARIEMLPGSQQGPVAHRRVAFGVFPARTSPEHVATAELDGDGDADIIVSFRGVHTKGGVYAWRGGQVPRNPDARLPTGNYGAASVLGDLDGDGLDDVVFLTEPVSGDHPPGLTLAWGDPDRLLRLDRAAAAVGTEAHAAAALDADGDGARELYILTQFPLALQRLDPARLGFDCDDSDAGIHPRATEVAGDGINQDCDGHTAP